MQKEEDIRKEAEGEFPFKSEQESMAQTDEFTHNEIARLEQYAYIKGRMKSLSSIQYKEEREQDYEKEAEELYPNDYWIPPFPMVVNLRNAHIHARQLSAAREREIAGDGWDAGLKREHYEGCKQLGVPNATYILSEGDLPPDREAYLNEKYPLPGTNPTT